MIPQDFDIEDFAIYLSKQAEEHFPIELSLELRQFIAKTIYKFIKITENALAKEPKIYNYDETAMICQLIAEWMYHKGIDNYKNDIPQEYWEPILQQVAFAIFENAKDAVNTGRTEDEAVELVENAVTSIYQELIEQLAKENKLTKSVDEILKQSSLHDYVEENYINEEQEQDLICISQVYPNKFWLCTGTILVVLIKILLKAHHVLPIHIIIIIILFLGISLSVIVSKMQKKLYFEVDKYNNINTFIIDDNNKKYFQNSYSYNDIDKIDFNNFSDTLVLYLINEKKKNIHFSENFNIQTLTKIKALLVKNYSNKVPQKWILSDRAVKNYIEKGELPSKFIPTNLTIIIITIIVFTIIFVMLFHIMNS